MTTFLAKTILSKTYSKYIVSTYYFCGGEPDDSNQSLSNIFNTKEEAFNFSMKEAQQCKKSLENWFEGYEHVIRKVRDEKIVVIDKRYDNNDLDEVRVIDFTTDTYGDRYVIGINGVNISEDSIKKDYLEQLSGYSKSVCGSKEVIHEVNMNIDNYCFSLETDKASLSEGNEVLLAIFKNNGEDDELSLASFKNNEDDEEIFDFEFKNKNEFAEMLKLFYTYLKNN